MTGSYEVRSLRSEVRGQKKRSDFLLPASDFAVKVL